MVDAEEAFQKMKKFMEILPILTVLIKAKVLIMYLTTLEESISIVLLIEREERQVPIYFVIRVLQGAELKYPALENLILAHVHAARRLRRLLVNGQPKKGTFRSQAAYGQAIFAKGKGNNERSIDDKEVSKVEAEKGETWMTPIYEYLFSGLQSEDLKETRKANNIVKEIHEGSCRFNTNPRSVVIKVMKQGYYWPLMNRDAARIIQDCTRCQEQSMAKKVSRINAIVIGNTWKFIH
ncbi:reverse transcriptase domain-containing protein [Tanacetum coccineum]